MIPTYNEENNIKNCLDRIYSQKYPKDKIEVLIVDNYSSDRTTEIAKELGASIHYNDIRDPEVSKLVGLRLAKSQFFMYLDADIELADDDFFKKLTKPLVENPEIVASFPRFCPKPGSTGISRYLRYHPLELDPLFQFLTLDLKETIIKRKDYYYICEFTYPNLPPIGICLYRKSIIDRLLKGKTKFMDNDVPVILAKNGNNRFAYVPSCRIYHDNIATLKDLLKKRSRNINNVFLPYQTEKEYVWIDLTKKREWLRLLSWIFIVNLILPLTISGAYKSIKYRDLSCMYEPLVGLVLTDYIMYQFLKTKKGRQYLLDKLLRRG